MKIKLASRGKGAIAALPFSCNIRSASKVGINRICLKSARIYVSSQSKPEACRVLKNLLLRKSVYLKHKFRGKRGNLKVGLLSGRMQSEDVTPQGGRQRPALEAIQHRENCLCILRCRLQ